MSFRFGPEIHDLPDDAPRLRLAFGAVFWRIFAGVFLVRELLFVLKLRKFGPGIDLPKRVAYLLIKMPETLFVAFASAAVATVVLDQIVRHLTQPRVRRWLSPRVADAGSWPIEFRLAGSELIRRSWPARWRDGRRWRPGLLAITDRRVLFHPRDWDAEPWELPLAEAVRQIALEPSPPMSWGFVLGVPDRVLFAASDPPIRLAVLDPQSVLEALRGPRPPGKSTRTVISEETQ